MFTCVLGRHVASRVLLVSKLSEGVDSFGRQLRGFKRSAPFSGVTKSGRAWRKVPENDARSVGLTKPIVHRLAKGLSYIQLNNALRRLKKTEEANTQNDYIK